MTNPPRECRLSCNSSLSCILCKLHRIGDLDILHGDPGSTAILPLDEDLPSFRSFPSTFVAVARGKEGILLLHFHSISSVIDDLLKQYMPVAFIVDLGKQVLCNCISCALAVGDALCPSGYSTSYILVSKIGLLFALPIGNPSLSFKRFWLLAQIRDITVPWYGEFHI
jgi:hypothetical protein